MPVEFMRKEILALIERLGGWHEQSLRAALDAPDDDRLAAVLRARIEQVTDICLLDAELLKSLPLEWRARLMARRTKLDVADRAAKSTASAVAQGLIPRPQVGNIEVIIPSDASTSELHTSKGRVCQARVNSVGVAVLDLFPDEFIWLLANPKNGLLWHDANPEARQHLSRALHNV